MVVTRGVMRAVLRVASTADWKVCKVDVMAEMRAVLRVALKAVLRAAKMDLRSPRETCMHLDVDVI